MGFLWRVLAVMACMALGALIWHMIFTVKKKTKVVGDLHIFPNEDGLTACYVAWETRPENLTQEDYVLLKVIHKPNSQN